MRLYEFEAKEVFKKYGIQIPKGGIAKTLYEAKKIAQSIGKPVAIKAQVLTGRRGKAGGIRFAEDLNKVEQIAAELLGSQLLGSKVTCLLIEEKLDISTELYVGITIDGVSSRIVIIVSKEGGMEIEEVAAKFPEKIVKEYVDIWIGLRDFQVRRLIKKMGLRGEQASVTASILKSLYNIFRDCDSLLVEINPLVVTKENSVVAVDARFSIDEFALDRHPEYKAKFRGRSHNLVGSELREYEAHERGIGAYVELDGDIGILANGASLGMEAIDLISDLGGRPACFCDIGGMLTAELVENSIDVVLSNPRVRALLFNILGGLVRCDVVAEGIVNYVKKKGVSLPMIVRLSGTLEKEGRNILKSAGTEAFDSLLEAATRIMKL